jgi:hypothetical protein
MSCLSMMTVTGPEDIPSAGGAFRYFLADYGFAEDSIAEAAEAILPSVPPSNPRPVAAADLRALLRAAWSGSDPRTAFSENQ